MTFFPPDPDRPELDEPSEQETPPWWAAPEDEIPAVLPVSELLASTAHASVALIGAFVHREGVLLRIERRLRRCDLPRAEWQRLLSAFAEHGMFGEAEDQAARLRFGLVLGDGERVLDGMPFGAGIDPTVRPERHSLVRAGGGGGGGDRSYAVSETLWLWPLPPAGPIELVMQWPALGIPEVRAVLDGTRLRALADDVVTAWPEA